MILSSESRVNTFRSNEQTSPDAALLQAGGYVTVWQSQNQDGSGWGVYFQLHSAGGMATGPEWRANGVTLSDQTQARVAATSDGGFVIVWEDNGGLDGSAQAVYGQRYSAAGAALGANFLVNTSTSSTQNQSDVAAYSGGFATVWASAHTGAWDIYLQRWNNDGSKNGVETLVSTAPALTTVQAGTQYQPQVAAQANGDLFIVWADQSANDGSSYGVYARRYDAAGATFSSTLLVNTATGGAQYEPSVATLSDGGYIVVWRSDDQDGSSAGVYGQRFNAGGAKAGGEFIVNVSTVGGQYQPSVTGLSTGGFVVAWYNDNYDVGQTGSTQDVYVREFDGSGLPLTGQVKLASLSNSTESQPGVVDIGSGRYLVNYVDATGVSGLGSDVMQQIFGPTAPAPQTPPVLGNFGGTVSFGENLVNAAPQVLQPVVSLTDVDSANFDGGQLDLFYVQGGSAEDQLGVRNVGNGPVQIGVSGSTVSFQGVAIGTISASAHGANGNRLVINFNAAATVDAVEALVQNLSYGNSSQSPTASRVVGLRISDGDGGATPSSTLTIEVTRQDDGTPALYGPERVNSYTVDDQTQPNVAVLADGSYVVVWQSYDQDSGREVDNTWGIYHQRFSAQGVAIGGEMRVNTVTAAQQDGAHVAALSTGGYVITWDDSGGVDGSGQGVIGQIYNGSGAPQGGNFVANSFSNNQQQYSDVAGYGSGFAVAWSSTTNPGGSSNDIYLQRFDNNGSKIGGERLVSTIPANPAAPQTSAQYLPKIAAYPNGDMVIVWRDDGGNDGGATYGVFGRRYTAATDSFSPSIVVNTTVVGNQYEGDVATLADGGFVVVWRADGAQDGSSAAVYGQRFDAAGAKVGGEFRINENTIGGQYQPSVTGLSSGGFVVSFFSDDYDHTRTGSYNDVYIREFDAAGIAVDGDRKLPMATATGSNTENLPSIADLGNGNFVVVYADHVPVVDGGNASTEITQQIFGSAAALPRQAAPVVGDFVGVVTFAENTVNAAPQIIDSAVSISDTDSANFAGGRLDLFYVQGGQASDQLGVRHEGNGVGQIGVAGNSVSFGGVAIGTISGGGNGSALRIDLLAGATADAVQALVQNLSYASTSNSPDASRTVGLRLSDGDGGSSAPSILTLNVTRELDGAPVVHGETRVNTYTAGDQTQSDTAVLADGSYVVVWQSNGQDGSGLGIYAQRFTGKGVPLGAEFRVNVETSTTQESAHVAALSSGGFVITWDDVAGVDGSGRGVIGQIYGATGAPQGANFVATTYTNSTQQYSDVAGYAGGFAVAWSSSGNPGGSSNDIYLQRFDNSGNKLGGERLVSTIPANPAAPQTSDQYLPRIAAYPNGDMVIVWRDDGAADGGATYGVFGRRYTAATDSFSPSFVVNTNVLGNQYEGDVATLADGGFIVVWRSDNQDGSGAGVYGQRFNAAGAKVGGEFLVNETLTGGQYQPSVTGLSTGGFVVAFFNDDYDLSRAGSYNDVYIREYDAAGNAIDGQRKLPMVTATGSNSENQPSIADLGGGNFVVTYTDHVPAVDGGNATSEITQQIFGSAAALARQANPELSDFTGSVTFAENLINTTPQVIDAAVGLSDVDSANFDGGRVDLFYVQGGEASDQLGVRHVGNGPAQIGVSGAAVSYGGVAIGTIIGGVGGSNLQINLLPGATVEAVEALVQNLTYASTSQSPAAARTVAVRVSDGDGGTSNSRTVTINVTPQLDGAALAYGESRVNSYVENQQDDPEITVLVDGSYVVVWTSSGQDGSSDGVYGQRFTSSGLPLGSEFKVNSTTANLQNYPHAAALSSGGFVVVWQDNVTDTSGYGVYAQRYDAAGVPAAGGAVLVNSTTSSNQYHGVVASYTGGYAVVWSSFQGGSYDIFMRRFDDAGVQVTPETRVSSLVGSPATPQPGTQELPDVAAYANGNLVFVWQDTSAGDGAANGVFGRTWNAGTGTFSDTFLVNSYTADSQYEPSVATLSDGGFVVVWRSNNQDGSSAGVYGQRYDSLGAKAGTEFQINERETGGQYQPAVTGLSTGGFVVTWFNDNTDVTGLGSQNDVYIREYAASGAAIDGERKLPMATATGSNTENLPAIADLGNGNFVVAYTDYVPAVDGGNATTEITQQIFGDIAELPRTSANPLLDDVREQRIYTNAPASPLFSGNAQLIDGDVRVSDADSANFDGGQLTLNLISGLTAADVLGIRNQGVAAGQIGVSGANVTYGGVTIGSFAGGAAGTGSLVVTFNASADAAAVRALAENLTYQNAAPPAGTTNRYVSLRLSDGDGGVSPAVAVQLTIQNTYTPPTLLLDDVSPQVTFSEAQSVAGAPVDTAVQLDYTGATGFANGKLVVSYTGSTARPEDQLSIRNEGSGPGQVAVSGSDVRYQGVSIGTISATLNGGNGSNLDITFKAAATDQAIERVVENLLYRNSSTDALATRNISINVTDGAGVSGTARAVQINVTPQADAGAVVELFGEQQTNTYEAGQQLESVVARLHGGNDGGYLIAWTSQGGQDGSGYGVYAQRYDARGAAVGPEFQANSQTINNQTEVAAAGLPNGGYVLVWRADTQDGSGSYGVYGQRYNADGSTAGGEFRANTTTFSNQYEPAVLGLSDGSFIVAYRSDYTGVTTPTALNDVLAQRFAADGSPLGAELTLNSAGGATQFQPQLSALSGGGFVAVWTDTSGDASGYGIGAQIFANNGSKVGALIAVNTTTTGTQQGADVAGLAGGGFVAVWESGNTVFAQRFTALGVKDGGEITVSTSDSISNGSEFARVAALGNGGFIVSWDSQSATALGGSGYDVAMQQFDASGAKVDGVRLVNDVRSSTQYQPDIVGLTGSNVVVTWSGYDQERTTANSYGIYHQLIGTAGSIVNSAAPLLVDLETSTTFDEDLVNAAPQLLDAGVSLTDSDSVNFDGGRLWVSVISGYGNVEAAQLAEQLPAQDWFGIRNQGNGPAQVGVSGSTVSYGGVAIGSITSDGLNGNDLVVLFNASATADGVEAVIENLTYRNISSAPVASRTVSVSVSDGDGGSSIPRTVVVNVTPQADGGQPLYGNERVNTYAPGTQESPDSARLSDGGYITVWASAGQDGWGQGVYAQRFDGKGVPLGAEFRINTNTADSQYEPTVTGLNGGGYVVAWRSNGQDGSGAGVYAQRFSNAGVAQGSEFRVNTTTDQNQYQPSITATADGGFVVAWYDDYYTNATNTEYRDVFFQRYNAAGVVQGVETRINPTGEGTTQQSEPQLAGLAGGGFVALWSDSAKDGSGYGVYGQRFAADGSASGLPFKVNSTTTGDQYEAQLAALNDGGFVVVWRSEGQDGSGAGVFGQRYDSAGATVGSEFRVNTNTSSTQALAAVAPLSNGGFAVGWYDNGFAKVQQFDASGARVDGELRVDTLDNNGNAELSSVVGLANGGFVVTFRDYDYGDGSTYNVYQQLYGKPADFVRQANPALVDVDSSVTFLENTVNAGPQLIDPVIGLSDADSANFDGGLLEVNYLTGYDLQNQLGLSGLAEQDQLGIRNQGSAAGQVGLVGSSVRFGGVEIGTLTSNGSNGSKLSVQFNANATVVAVERVIENLTYANSFSDPGASRTVSIRVSDGDGGASVARSVVINVTPQFDAAQPLFDNERVNSYEPGTQTAPAMARLSDGSYITVWTSQGSQDGWDSGVYGQRFDAQGVPLGTEFQVNTYTPFSQYEPSVAALQGGGYVVVWRSDNQDGSGTGTYAQRYSNAGVPQGSEFRVNTTTDQNQYQPVVAGTADGGFVIAWYDDYYTNVTNTEYRDILFQRYNAAGVAQGGETRANPTGEGTTQQYEPTIAGLSGGGFVALWTDTSPKDGSSYGVYGQRFAADGSALGSLFRVNTTTASDQSEADVAGLGGGGFVAVWTSNGQDSSGYGIYAQRYDATGAPVGDEFRVNNTVTGSQTQASVSPLSHGGFVVTWNYEGRTMAQQFDAAGTRLDGEIRVDTLDNNNNASLPEVLGLAGGGFVVAWPDYDYSTSSYNIYQQFYGDPAANARQANPQLVDVSTSVTFKENLLNAAPQVLDPGVGLVDTDSANFDGGTLEVNYLTGYGAQDQLGLQGLDNQDQLSIRNQGSGAGQVGVSGNSVSYGGVQVGSITSNGANGAKLTVVFNASATADAVEHVIENLSYANTVSNPIASRTVSIRVTDGDGGASEPRSLTINVTPETDGAVRFGAEKVVNTTVAAQQHEPAVARLADGGYVVTWEDQGGADGSGYGVYFQRYDLNDSPVGGQTRVNTFTTGNQYEAQVAGLTGGGFVIVWRSDNQDGSGTGVFGQRYTAAGAADGVEFLVNTSVDQNQYQPSIAATADGGFVVAWYDDYYTNAASTEYRDILFQRYNAAGVVQGVETRANPSGEGTTTQSQPALAGLGGGGFVAVWTDASKDGNGNGVYGQIFSAAGSPVGGSTRINSFVDGAQDTAAVAGLKDGGYVVVWESASQDLSSTGIYGQRFNAAGTAVGAEFRINTNINGQQYQPAVTALENGGWAVSWTDTNVGSYDVFVQQYDAAGRAVDGETRVNSYNPSTQYEPAIASTANGGFVVAYAGYIATGDGNGDGAPDGGNDTYEIRLQRFSNTAPQVSDVTVQGQEDAVITINNTVFEGGFIDPEGQSLQAVRIVTPPADGTLSLNGVPVTPGQEIGLADLQAGLLTYQGNADFFGNDEFRWTGSDGIAFATTPVFTNIVLSNVNDGPRLGVLGNSTGSEGTFLTRTLDIGDPDPDSHRVTVNWGDGSPNSVFTTSSPNPNIGHAYAENQVYAVTVTVDDQRGQANSVETRNFSIDVANAAPTIALSGNSGATQGETWALTLAQPFDLANTVVPGTDTVDQYTVDWGDGSPVEVYTPATLPANRIVTHVYSTPGSKLVSVGLRDEDGSYAAAGTRTVVVAAPAEVITVNAGADVNAVEGTFFSQQINFTDPTDQGTAGRSYSVNWGDGQTSTGFIPAGNTAFNIGHSYADNAGPYTVLVTVDDSDVVVQQGSDSFIVTVANQAPAVGISGAGSVAEGSLYTVTLNPSDPGADTISQYVINWGDGSTQTYTAATLPANRQLTHTYADGNATFQITVDVTDEDGTFAAAGQANIFVANVAPTAPVTGADTVAEGGNYTLNVGAVTDPGQDTRTGYSINWGDGSPASNFTPEQWAAVQAGGGNVNHVFADGAALGTARTISVLASDEDGSHTLGSKTLTVSNVAPTLVLTGANVSNEAATYTLGISASDPGGASDLLSYSIDWGDGSPLQTLTAGQLAALSGLVPHVYADDADGPVNSTPRTISVTVDDGDNGVNTQTQIVNVNNVAPTAPVSGAATVNEGSIYTLSVGAVVDPGPDTRTGYSINWGDGSTEGFSLAQWAAAVGSFNHFYADGAAAYTIVVSASDEDGSFVLGSRAINVLNVNPTIELSGDASIDEGGSYVLSINAGDAGGSGDPLSFSINWGDGSPLQNLTAAQLTLQGGTVQHEYADDQDGPINSTPRNISVTVSDGDGGSATAGRTVNVDNVAPTISLGGGGTSQVGQPYTLQLGDITDPGTDTVTSYSISWGDDTPPQTLTAAQVLALGGNVPHTFASPGTYPIVVTLLDEDGSHAEAGVQEVVVSDLVPTVAIEAGPDGAVNEGSSFTRSVNFTDGEDNGDPGWLYTINYGDGSAPVNGVTLVKTIDLSHVYADGNATRTVTVTVEDGLPIPQLQASLLPTPRQLLSESASDSFTVNVSNVAPTASVSGAATASEGSAYALTVGAVNDPGADTRTGYSINWGDGNTESFTPAQWAAAAGNFSHIYADGAGAATIVVSTTDEDGTFTLGSQAVSVLNVNPTLNISGAAAVNEGGSYALSISASDPAAAADPLSYSIDWGDGSALQSVTAAQLATAGGVISHTYADDEDGAVNSTPRSISVTVSDGDGGSATAGRSVNVNNVAPTAAVSGAATASEGSAYALTVGAVNDPGADTRTGYSINWGDGSTDTFTSAQWSAAAGNFSHTYADGAGAATIVVSTTDEDGTFTLGSQAVSVLNVNPTLNISGAAAINEGGSYALSISASDPAAGNDLLSYSIDWGDGSAPQSVTATQLATAGGVISHTFVDDEDGAVNSTPRNISVTVSDGDGGSANQVKVVNVNNVAPTISLGGGSAAQVAQPYALVLGAITDPGTDTVSSYTINWGDGTALQTLTAAQVLALGGNVPHTYATAGSYGIAVALQDEDGSYTNAGTLAVLVSAQVPTVAIEAGPAGSVNEGGTFTRSISFTDGEDNGAPGWTYSIDYGDGSAPVTGSTTVKSVDLSHLYADGDAARTVTVSVSDGAAETASDSFAVTVSNVAPTATVSGAATANEGSAYALTVGAVNDPGADTRTGYSINWGDGNTDTFTPAQWAAAAGNFSHIYADGAAAATIVVSATDEDGTFTLGSQAVSVLNVNPTLNISGAAAINEGGSYALSISASDPAAGNDLLSYSIDWGDGSALQSVTAAQLATAGGVISHSYADDEDGPVNSTPRSISVTVSDGDGGSATAGRSVSVNNVAPGIALGGSGTAQAAQPYTLQLGAITDPGTDTVSSYSIDWGDGSAPQTLSAAQVLALGGNLPHTYAAAGSYGIAVALQDEDGSYASAGTQTVVVSALAPTVALEAGPDATLPEGSTFTRSIVFTDGEDNGAPGWSYSIDYGDGSPLVTGNTLVKSINLSHLYDDGDATRTVTVVVSDNASGAGRSDGGPSADTPDSASDSLVVTVSNVAPTAALTGASSVNEGSSYTLNVGPVVDPGADTRTSYNVAWGDGSVRSYTPAEWAATGGVLTHVYADGASSPTIVVSATDEDGTFTLGSKTVQVANVSPTLELTGAASVDEGGSYALGISASDAGAASDPLSYSINWGDGSALQSLTAAQLAALGGTVSHVYADDADGPVNTTPRSISVTVSDGDGGSATQGRSVDVNNVAPTIALGGLGTSTVGAAYTLVLGAITDPGPDTVTSWLVNWGDGSPVQTYSAGGPVTHTYGSAGSPVISVGLVDEDGTWSNAGTQAVTVTGVPTQSVTIGNAPTRLTIGNLDAWVKAWTHPSITLTHKADVKSTTEAWSPVTLNNLANTTLAGGDVTAGDLGVSGRTLQTSLQPQDIDGSEGLRLALALPALSATLNLSSLTRNDEGLGYAEAGRIQAFDDGGMLVAETVFSARFTAGTQAVNIAFAGGFSSLVITSGAYNGSTWVEGAYANLDGSFGTAPFLQAGRLRGSDFLLDAATADLVVPSVQLAGLAAEGELMTNMMSIPSWAQL